MSPCISLRHVTSHSRKTCHIMQHKDMSSHTTWKHVIYITWRHVTAQSMKICHLKKHKNIYNHLTQHTDMSHRTTWRHVISHIKKTCHHTKSHYQSFLFWFNQSSILLLIVLSIETVWIPNQKLGLIEFSFSLPPDLNVKQTCYHKTITCSQVHPV